jgi:hypothetical protein
MNLGSIEGSPRLQSAPSSHRQMDNPYFLQTNASIFERNPFSDFTTNKLHEILGQKDIVEINQLKDDALRYHEKLEKGYINRLERRSELSPKSSQRKKYELEKWVSSERSKIPTDKERSKYQSEAGQKPINLFDLDEERKEAALIIENVNKKAKEIKQ